MRNTQQLAFPLFIHSDLPIGDVIVLMGLCYRQKEYLFQEEFEAPGKEEVISAFSPPLSRLGEECFHSAKGGRERGDGVQRFHGEEGLLLLLQTCR